MQPMLTVALNAARKAAQIIERASLRMDKVQIEKKARNDFVTQVDKAAEKEIIDQLRKAYPDHGIIAEESGENLTDSDYHWIIDPLDGTTNFIRGIPHYAVSIACVHKNRLEHAVVLDVVKREEFTASRGRGAQLNGHRIRVSNINSLDGALVGTGIPFSGRPLEKLEPYLESLKTITSQTAGIRRAGAAALDMAYVAAGRLDGFWELYLKPWDIAAGSLLVTEAGGLVCDLSGGNSHLKAGCILAATPKVAKQLLPITREHLGNF